MNADRVIQLLVGAILTGVLYWVGDTVNRTADAQGRQELILEQQSDQVDDLVDTARSTWALVSRTDSEQKIIRNDLTHIRKQLDVLQSQVNTDVLQRLRGVESAVDKHQVTTHPELDDLNQVKGQIDEIEQHLIEKLEALMKRKQP